MAYVVFAHTSGLEKALSMKCTESNPFILSTQASPVTNVVERKMLHSSQYVYFYFNLLINISFLGWCENYNKSIVNTKELQFEINSYMADYDKISAERIRVEKEAVDDEDEDGWKTVTKKYIILSNIDKLL